MITLGELTGLRRAQVCDRKVAHRSLGKAEAHIRAIRNAGKSDEAERGPLNAYPCRCGAWHTGHLTEVAMHEITARPWLRSRGPIGQTWGECDAVDNGVLEMFLVAGEDVTVDPPCDMPERRAPKGTVVEGRIGTQRWKLVRR